eukprot:SAG31_NODE_1534_length_7987_cov_35.780933_3_plen_663_part_00
MHEVKLAMQKQGMHMSEEEVKQMFNEVDESGDGEIDFEEFMQLMTQASDNSDLEGADLLGEERDDANGHRIGQKQGVTKLMQVAVKTAAELGEKASLEQLLEVLNLAPNERSEFALQRLLMRLQRLKFFNKLPPPEVSDLRLEVCRVLNATFLHNDALLFKEESIGDDFYIVLQGCVQIQSKGETVAILEEGISFGEMALLADREEDRRRTMGAVAGTDATIVLHMCRADYLRLIKASEERRLAKTVTFLQSTVHLGRLPPNLLLSLAHVVKPVAFHRGQVIAAQGARPHSMFIMQSGQVDVTVELPGRFKILVASSVIGGEVLCEAAIFEGASNPSTLTASVRCEGYACSKRDARKFARGPLLSQFQQIRALRASFIRQRITQGAVAQLCAPMQSGKRPLQSEISLANTGVERKSERVRADDSVTIHDSLSSVALRQRHKAGGRRPQSAPSLPWGRSRTTSALAMTSVATSASRPSVPATWLADDLDKWSPSAVDCTATQLISNEDNHASARANDADASTPKMHASDGPDRRERRSIRPRSAKPVNPIVSKDAKDIFRHIDEAISVCSQVAVGTRSRGTKHRQSVFGSMLIDPRQATTPQRSSVRLTRSTQQLNVMSRGKNESGKTVPRNELSLYGSFALDAFAEKRLSRKARRHALRKRG